MSFNLKIKEGLNVRHTLVMFQQQNDLLKGSTTEQTGK